MLKRFSVSLDENLLSRFDGYLDTRGYANRSEAIRDLIRKVLIGEEWERDSEVVGVVTLVYNHHQAQLQERITELQHAFHHQITSTTHVHMDHDNCLEVIVLRGEGKDVRVAAEKMMSLKGVKHVKLTTTSMGKEL